jgi:hypothetical protein
VPFSQAQSQCSEHVGFLSRNDNNRGVCRNGRSMADEAKPSRP